MKFDYIDCPICENPDTRSEIDEEGNRLVYCSNHACGSNGGQNIKGIINNNSINPQIELDFDKWLSNLKKQDINYIDILKFLSLFGRKN